MLKAHPDMSKLKQLWPAIRQYQRLADKHGIFDIFQDNGGKLLQVLLLTGLKIIPGREGNDAKDMRGRGYELKTMNAELVTSFSTHHHLNPDILAKYRKVPWVFAIYRNIEIASLYLVSVGKLEPYFSRWKAKIEATARANEGKGRVVSMNTISINNPKINASFVEEVGQLVLGQHYSAVRESLAAKKKNANVKRVHNRSKRV